MRLVFPVNLAKKAGTPLGRRSILGGFLCGTAQLTGEVPPPPPVFDGLPARHQIFLSLARLRAEAVHLHLP